MPTCDLIDTPLLAPGPSHSGCRNQRRLAEEGTRFLPGVGPRGAAQRVRGRWSSVFCLAPPPALGNEATES